MFFCIILLVIRTEKTLEFLENLNLELENQEGIQQKNIETYHKDLETRLENLQRTKFSYMGNHKK